MKDVRVRDQRGFTLTELLVTLAILGLIMTAVATVQIAGHRIFFTGENQAEAQQAARAAMLMEDDLRLIGTGCPVPGCFGGAAPCNQPQAAPTSICQDATTPAANKIVFWADLANASSNTALNQLNVGDTLIRVRSAAGFANGDRVFIFNGNTFETKILNNVNVGANTITVSTGLVNGGAQVYPIGTVVGRPQVVEYSLAGTTLSRNSGAGGGLQPIATGISGLTFSYFNAADAALAPLPLSAANAPLIRRIQVVTRAQSTATQNAGTFGITTNVRPRALP